MANLPFVHTLGLEVLSSWRMHLSLSLVHLSNWSIICFFSACSLAVASLAMRACAVKRFFLISLCFCSRRRRFSFPVPPGHLVVPLILIIIVVVAIGQFLLGGLLPLLLLPGGVPGCVAGLIVRVAHGSRHRVISHSRPAAHGSGVEASSSVRTKTPVLGRGRSMVTSVDISSTSNEPSQTNIGRALS